MVKVENNEIKIYRNIDKEKLKVPFIILLIGFVYGIVMSVLLKTWFFFNILSIISGILLLVCLNLYKQSGKETLVYSLSKDEFIIYKKEKILKKYSTLNINSFVIFPSQYNEVVLNFKNEKGKDDAKIFMMQGCKNIEFVEMANKFIKSDVSIEDIEKDLKRTYQ